MFSIVLTEQETDKVGRISDNEVDKSVENKAFREFSDGEDGPRIADEKFSAESIHYVTPDDVRFSTQSGDITDRYGYAKVGSVGNRTIGCVQNNDLDNETDYSNIESNVEETNNEQTKHMNQSHDRKEYYTDKPAYMNQSNRLSKDSLYDNTNDRPKVIPVNEYSQLRDVSATRDDSEHGYDTTASLKRMKSKRTVSDSDDTLKHQI